MSGETLAWVELVASILVVLGAQAIFWFCVFKNADRIEKVRIKLVNSLYSKLCGDRNRKGGRV